MKNVFATIIFAVVAMTATAHTARQVGGDISLLTKYETNGAQYYDLDGNRITDMLSYLKQQEWNAMRVRLFVDPTNSGDRAACQDIEYVKALGKRIKDAGFSLMLDFHYSDTWADPVKQWTPASWVSLSDAELYTKIYDYTKDVLQQMNEAGATPDFIQTGNEISYGMLWGASDGSSKKYYAGQSSNRDRFTKLLKQAGKACREVCPNAKIVLHTERVANTNYAVNFYNDMKNAAVDYDIIGLSFYSYYHGNLTQLETTLNSLETNFADKEIMIVEVGYFYAWQPTISSPGVDLSATYPISPDGQKAYTEALIATLNKHNKVVGLYWWWPEACEYGLDWNTKRVSDGWYNASLFNDDAKTTSAVGYTYPGGKAMPTVAVLKNFLTDTGILSATGDKASWLGAWYTLNGQKLTGKPSQNGIYINNGRKVVVK